jgi:hypothetical protein
MPSIATAAVFALAPWAVLQGECILAMLLREPVETAAVATAGILPNTLLKPTQI